MKKLVKFFIYAIFYVLTLPFGLSSKLVYRLFGTSMVFDIFAQMFSLCPGICGTIARACFYKQTLAEAHLDLDIGFGSFVSKIETSIGPKVLITGRTTIGHAVIGEGAVIANYVSILSGRYQHNFKDPARPVLDKGDDFSRIVIGRNSFIGEHSVVMADIGANSIVGAGSIVVKPIPENAVAVGNPARVVKSRTAEYSLV